MANLRTLTLCVLAGILPGAAALAQTAAPAARSAARIVSAIDEEHLVTLKGNVNPRANAKNDLGPVSASFALPDLTLVLSRSADAQAAFDAYVAGEYDPGSAYYHQWLTPAQIGERFGPAQADINAITGWLGGHGFTVNSVAPDRMTINFSGTAGQIASAFHTEIHSLSVNGERHYANMTDPQIPEALSSVVVGVKALHNFLPRPLHKMGSQVQFNKEQGKWQRLTNVGGARFASGLAAKSAGSSAMRTGGARPEFSYTDSFGDLIEDVAPYDFAAIYNILPLWNASTPINGTGQIIAIAGTSEITASDVTTFRSVFGLPAGPTLQQIDTKAEGTTASECTSTSSNAVCNQEDWLENSLDAEWAGAVAPGAQIDLVVTGQPSACSYSSTSSEAACIDSVYDSANYVVQNAKTSGNSVYGASILSLSYGNCELANGTTSNVAYYNLWQSAAAEGISVFVASGDSGSPACDQGNDSDGVPYSAQFGLTVNAMASTPYNTAVGGTDLAWCKPTVDSSGNTQGCASTNAASYWNTTNSSTNQSNAKGYIPEIPWNDSCLNPLQAAYIESVAGYSLFVQVTGVAAPTNAEAACNYVYNNWEIIASNISDDTEGDPYVMAPFVDTVGAGGGASNCVVNNADTVNANTLPTCTAGATSAPNGSSTIALYNNGWPKPAWQVGFGSLPFDGVRDIPDVSFFAADGALDSATLVCIGALTQSGTCSVTGTSLNMLEVGGTSVATPEMAGVMALINQSAGSAQGLPNATLYSLASKQNYSNCSSENGSTSSSCYFNDVDTGTISMPCAVSTQTVEGGALYDSNTRNWNLNEQQYSALASPNCTAVNSGDAVGTLVSSGTTQGYAAVTGFDLATGLGSMNVANVVNAWPANVIGSATATVAVVPSPTSINSDQALSVTVTVGTSGALSTPTGTVTLTAGSYSSTETLNSSGAYTFTIPANTFTTSGTVTLTAGYHGDSIYSPASGSATVTVTGTATQATYSLAATTPTAVSAGSSATSTISGTSTTGYTGTVTFSSCALTSSSVTNPNSPPTCSVSGSITFTGGTASGTGMATVTTTATHTSSMARPKIGGWAGAGGAVLAFLVFLGIPARRRSWRAMLGLLVVIAALGSLSACGGGVGGGGGTTIQGTSAGTYTFTVTGTGSDSAATKANANFTLTVN